MNEKRAALIALSNALKPLVKMGEFECVNDAIVDSYKTLTAREFETYNGWLDRGFKVRKGSKGKPVWGKPKQSRKTAQVEGDEYKYFPMAFLFSNEDVEPLQARNAA